MQIALSLIRVDGGTQPRAAINTDAVEAYADAMKSGAIFPPVDVFYDGGDYWLADGFHRVRAAVSIGAAEIGCNVLQGTLEDAQWHSIGANQSNGLYRSNADKQRAIEAALRHPKSQGLSDSAIGKHVGVHHETVRDWRAKLEASCEIRKIDNRTVTRNGTTYQMNTEQIGSRSKRDQALAIMLAEPEKPSDEIATEVGVDVSVIARWRREAGLPLPPKRNQRLDAMPADGPKDKRHEIRLKAQVERLLVGLNQIVGASGTLTALHLPAIASALSREQKDQVRVLIRRARKDIGIIVSALEEKNVSSSETDQLSDDAA